MAGSRAPVLNFVPLIAIAFVRRPAGRFRSISVPAPCSVKSSSRTERGTLPLMMTTASTLGDHVHAALDLRDHPARDSAVLDQFDRLCRGHGADQLPLLVQHPVHVGEQKEALCFEGDRDCSREGVGVDIQRLAFGADTDRGHHRNEVGIDDHVDDVGFHQAGIADEAEIQHTLDIGFGIAHAPLEPLGPHQIGVLAANADSLAALIVDGRDDLFVHGARKDHLDHVHRFPVGDAQAALELALDI